MEKAPTLTHAKQVFKYLKLVGTFKKEKALVGVGAFSGHCKLLDSSLTALLGTAIFAAFICAGQLLLSAGTFQQRFWFMKLAR